MKDLFKKAKASEKKEKFSKCHSCNSEFIPDERNKKRGWGMFCSKSCSTRWRNKKKTKSEKRDYNLKRIGI